MMLLSEGQLGKHYRIQAITGSPDLTQRLMEFGLFDGEVLRVIAFAPLGDPMEIEIGSTRLSLRKTEAACVLVELIP